MQNKMNIWTRIIKKKFNSRPAKTPTIIQMEATECGAICLTIILAYYGRYILPEEARLACDVSRDGSKAINIIRAAREYGLETYGYNIINIKKFSSLKMPCIIYWEFNHFVVLEGFKFRKKKKEVYINDPAMGPLVITLKEFNEKYTGIAIELSPSPEFKKGGKPEKGILELLWLRIKNSKMIFIHILILTSFLVIPNIAIPGFAKIFIDNILIDDQIDWAFALLGGMVLTAIFRGLLIWVQERYMLGFKVKLKIDTTVPFFQHLLKLPMRFYDQRSTGDLVNRVWLNNSVSELISSKIIKDIISLLSILLYSIAMFLLDKTLTVIILFITSINFLLLFIVQRKIIDRGRRTSQDLGRLAGVEMNSIMIIETVKANSLEKYFFQRWENYYSKAINSQLSMEVYNLIVRVLSPLLYKLSYIILLVVGSYFIIQGNLTIGTLIAIQLLLINFNSDLEYIIELVSTLQEAKGNLMRLTDVLTSKEDVHPSHSDFRDNGKHSNTYNEIELSNYCLEIRKITFGYSKMEVPTLVDFSIKLDPGSTISIVGPSGSGKSTISKLISGLYQPWNGEICLENHKISEIPHSILARYISVVDQKIILFEGSLKDNLTLWKKDVSDEIIWEALKTTCMDEVVAQRGGLMMQVKESGRNFSGGQQQRLEISRALISNPKILILDEATSALDTISEEKIYSNIRKRKCSLLVIAHRLSTIRSSDHIIVIDKGVVVEEGKHDVLMNRKGLYSQLVLSEMSRMV